MDQDWIMDLEGMRLDGEDEKLVEGIIGFFEGF